MIVIPTAPHVIPTVMSSRAMNVIPSHVIPSGVEGTVEESRSLHALRLVEMTNHALCLVEMTRRRKTEGQNNER